MTDPTPIGANLPAAVASLRAAERCTYCGNDDDVTVCCSQHPRDRICRLCRNARKGSKYPHRVPSAALPEPEPGALQPPYPPRFSGQDFVDHLEALRVTAARATPCEACGRLMIAAAGSRHGFDCSNPSQRRFGRVPDPNLAELALQGLSGVTSTPQWKAGADDAVAALHDAGLINLEPAERAAVDRRIRERRP